MPQTVVTRFAPSPTEFLHINNARTAVLNWLYARNHGGRMLLRIEDIDRERSTPSAIETILDDLRWLGLEWEGEIVHQSTRADRHIQVAHGLLARGHAHRCYATQEELRAIRDRSRKNAFTQHDGRWRDRWPGEVDSDVTPTINLNSPLEEEIIIEDLVHGRVQFPSQKLNDFVLVRSDGTPTYMLAVVVDDYDMGVTHIIRSNDHLLNAGRQTHLYRLLGWKTPLFAHIPLIVGPDGTKLSKRHCPLGIDTYRAMGYLPCVLRNYLAQLGMIPGDLEGATTKELVRIFDLANVQRSSARFDISKLEEMNTKSIRAANPISLVEQLCAAFPFLEHGARNRRVLDEPMRAQLLKAMPALKLRARTLDELLDNAEFIFTRRPLVLDTDASKILMQGGRNWLRVIMPRLEALEEWNSQTTEIMLRDLSLQYGVKLRELAQPLRAALAGRTTTPSIFEVLVILGRSESIARVADQLSNE